MHVSQTPIQRLRPSAGHMVCHSGTEHHKARPLFIRSRSLVIACRKLCNMVKAAFKLREHRLRQLI